ncbi:MAG: BMP family ABC transporter substrate-binding protein, partial [Acidimicrobiia bacterium]|nr:BMP family ABC transporter substrate-binding protein [Acidimicrobiia bacterium]
MGKSLKWLMALLITLSLVAASCGSDDDGDGDGGDSTTTTAGSDGDEAADGADEAADTATDTATGEGVRVALVLPGEINDLSWNQQMYEGALALQDEGLVSEVAFTELVPEGDAERAIRGYADDGFELVVAHS